MAGYEPHRYLVDNLMFGFLFGFCIHFQGAERPFEARNLRSALDNPKAVDSKLNKELEVGLLVLLFRRHLNIFVCHH